MRKQHSYKTQIIWTGNRGEGTSKYDAYDRNHTLRIENKADILCSSDPAFRGDNTKLNPEEMLLAAISSCHMLWYLHFCADNKITVVEYVDNAIGKMQELETGGGHFTEVILKPIVTILEPSLVEKANELHAEANKKCFIANSLNFPVLHQPECMVQQG